MTPAAAMIDRAELKVRQRDKALTLANVTRITNAQTLRQIKAMAPADGCLAAAAILRDPLGVQVALRVGLLLTAPRGMGPKKARIMLKTVPMSMAAMPLVVGGDTRIGAMTARQRDALADMLDDRWRTL